jgi:hypothetical protein
MRQLTVKLILLLVANSLIVFAQNKDDLFQKGLQCKKQNNIDEALFCFQQLLKSDSANVEFLTYGSMFYSKKGNEFSDENKTSSREHTFILGIILVHLPSV